MAMAARYERGLLDPDTPLGQSVFDHKIWVICSDGDVQEGVSAEASPLAGTQELGSLNVIYDDNRISIEGDTHMAFTEDVSARYRAYGWHVIDVDAASDGNIDRVALDAAILSARAETTKPTFIRMKSVIAWPAPNAQGTAKSHGSALGESEIAETKKALGLDPAEHFAMPSEVLTHVRKVKARGATEHSAWNEKFSEWEKNNSERAKLLMRLRSRALPANWEKAIPEFGYEKEIATRKASGDVIQEIAKVLPEFWGGSADLADSNNTTIEGGGSFLPLGSSMQGADPYGRVIHFGIREHAMGSILNGITLHGLTRTFGGTFLVFSDYMRPAARLASLMNLGVTFVWSHDSIGLGEDGPTHQPIEHIAALRAIPGLAVIRPADANEVAESWKNIITRDEPSALLLSRQNLPVFDRTAFAPASGVAQGLYILKEATATPQAILIATGSEVSLAVAAQTILESRGIPTRVVSAPCLEWFAQQPRSYKDLVLPPTIRVRVSIEAGISQGWREYVGDSGSCVSLEHFGASASAPILFKEFGFTAEHVVEEVVKQLP
jgi:transketolase